METTINQNYIVDNYWNMLKGLSDNVKLALISKLSSSIVARQEAKNKSPKLSDFYGVMADTPYPSIDEIRDVMHDEDKGGCVKTPKNLKKKITKRVCQKLNPIFDTLAFLFIARCHRAATLSSPTLSPPTAARSPSSLGRDGRA